MNEVVPADVMAKVEALQALVRVLVVLFGVLTMAVSAVLVMQFAKLNLHRRMDRKVTHTLGRMDEVLTAQARLQGVYEAVSHWQAAQAVDVVKQVVEAGVERVEKKIEEQPKSNPNLAARPAADPK